MRKTFILLCALALVVSLSPSYGQEVSPHPLLSRATSLRELVSGQPLRYDEALRADGLCGTFEGTLFDCPQVVSFVRIRPGAFTLAVVSAEGAEADSTSALCLRENAVAGINGSYFNMRELTPVTFIKDNGYVRGSATQINPFLTNGAVLLRDEVIRIDAVDTTRTRWDGWLEVMASGPILVDEGEYYEYSEGIPEWESFYAARHPRSLVGMDENRYVWLVVVDGRAEKRAVGMTIAELTELASMIHLTDALNLDGGGSSTLWTLPGGVLNHPSDNRSFDSNGQRIVPNILAVLPSSPIYSPQ